MKELDRALFTLTTWIQLEKLRIAGYRPILVGYHNGEKVFSGDDLTNDEIIEIMLSNTWEYEIC